MNKSVKISLVIALLILENVGLFFVADFYFQNKQYKEILKANHGVTQACKNLAISESLFSVLQKMKGFYPSISISSGKIHLGFGDEWLSNAGVGLVFDENYKLTNKACNSSWEPDVPAMRNN